MARGIYDYPKYSELLKKQLSPDIEQVSRAYARKFNWKIEVSGESALNILGLSTQVVVKLSIEQRSELFLKIASVMKTI